MVIEKGVGNQILFIAFTLDQLSQAKNIDSSLKTGSLFDRGTSLDDIVNLSKKHKKIKKATIVTKDLFFHANNGSLKGIDFNLFFIKTRIIGKYTYNLFFK